MALVILTDEKGTALGVADLREAHTGEGKLHKAFSVYVFRKDGTELLIQKRSATKMLWPLTWANTCCSHPREGETILEAAIRRLKEELGITCPLREHSTYVYRAEDPGHGVEHEHVTIVVGEAGEDVTPRPDLAEIAEWRWVSVTALPKDMECNPENYSPWFPLGLQQILSHL